MRNYCDICNNKFILNLTLPQAATFNNYPLSGDFNLAYCTICDFAWNKSKSIELNYTDYYINYNKHHKRTGYLKSLDEAYFNDVINKIINHVSNINLAHIVDYGSGDKSFGALALKAGFFGESSYDITNDLPADSSADVVTCLHTMEHFFDFKKNLTEIRNIIKLGGIAYIAVPNMKDYLKTYYGAFNAIDFEHINHFTIKSMCKLMNLIGFEIIEFGERNRQVSELILYPELWVIAKKTEKNKIISLNQFNSSINALVDYINISIHQFDILKIWHNKKLIEIKERGEISILYGLGTPALRLFHLSTLLPNYISDNDPKIQGKKINSHSVFNYLEISKIPGVLNFIVVAVNASRIKEFLIKNEVPEKNIHVFDWLLEK